MPPPWIILLLILCFFVCDVLIEFRLPFLTLRQEVKADTADMLPGTEFLRAVNLVALYLELHQSPGVKSHLVASAQVTVDDSRESHHHAEDVALGGP